VLAFRVLGGEIRADNRNVGVCCEGVDVMEATRECFYGAIWLVGGSVMDSLILLAIFLVGNL
jgi:hypothetical protein